MNMPIDVPKGERGTIRVFAINLPVLEVAALLEGQSKPDLARALLNAPDLDTDTTEIFPVSDLAGLGLATYLADGYGVDEAQVQADHSRLNALDGYVLLLFSDSFAGRAVQLDPGADLTLIGTYTEYQPAGAPDALLSDSALPYTGAPVATPPPASPRGPAGSALVVIALLAAALIIWWLVT